MCATVAFSIRQLLDMESRAVFQLLDVNRALLLSKPIVRVFGGLVTELRWFPFVLVTELG